MSLRSREGLRVYIAHVIELLPSKQEAPCSNPSPEKKDRRKKMREKEKQRKRKEEEEAIGIGGSYDAPFSPRI
jgi:hypothetical protein